MHLNKKATRNFIRDFLRLFLGRKIYICFRFFITHGYFPRLKYPRSFSEKIQYRKLNVNAQDLSLYVDKYTVRKYVREAIGVEYLIPLIFKTTFLKESDFDQFPHEFVIKTSNGGGGENVLVVRDKSLLNLSETCDRFNNYLKEKIGSKIDEHFYDIEEPYILIEKLMKHSDGSLPSDYKIHIFNSKLFIQVDSDRFGSHKRSIFDTDLNKLNFEIQPKYEPVCDDYSFPKNVNEMLKLAKKLAGDFKYIRVDMYNIDGDIFFGELTFCHGSGWEPIKPTSADFNLGKLWKEYN